MVDQTPDVLIRPDDWARYAGVDSDASELNTMRERVAYILNRSPETRNSDKALFVEYLQVFHDLDPATTALEVVRQGELPAQTAVARARADLQNRYKLYLPTRPEVMLKRQRRRTMYQEVFQHLDELDIEVERELVLYSDESGTGERYLVFGFVTFLRGRDNYLFTQRVLEGRDGKRPYFHFKDLRPHLLPDYRRFFGLGAESSSFRAYVHVFERADLKGPKSEVLLRSLEVASVETVRAIKGEGLIAEGHKISFFPDEGQGVLFFKSLEQRLEPHMGSRGFLFGGVEPQKSGSVFPVQLADVITSSFGRKLNAPGEGAKDEMAEHVLSFWGIENALHNGTYGNLTVVNHGTMLSDVPG